MVLAGERLFVAGPPDVIDPAEAVAGADGTPAADMPDDVPLDGKKERLAILQARISQMAGQGNRMAQMLLPIMENGQALDNYVAACQVGITISSLVTAFTTPSMLA